MASQYILNLDNQSFDSTVQSAATVVLVDFWAPWCGPCKAIGPVLDELAEELQGKVVIAKVNIDDYPELASKFSVTSIPTLLVFKNGTVADRMVGAKGKAELMAKLV